MFYGKIGLASGKTFNAEIVLASQNDLTINPAYVTTATGWNQARKLKLKIVVPGGVTIGSTSTGTPAMRITGFNSTNHSITLDVQQNGSIRGRGGAGGAGAGTATCAGSSGGSTAAPGNGSPGGAGGVGLRLESSISLNNNGVIGGGGGGNGGCGASSYSTSNQVCNTVCQGGGCNQNRSSFTCTSCNCSSSNGGCQQDGLCARVRRYRRYNWVPSCRQVCNTVTTTYYCFVCNGAAGGAGTGAAGSAGTSYTTSGGAGGAAGRGITGYSNVLVLTGTGSILGGTTPT